MLHKARIWRDARDPVSSPDAGGKASPPNKPQLSVEEQGLVDQIAKLGEGNAKLVYSRPRRIKVLAARENLVAIAKFIKDALKFDRCANVTGTDFPKEKVIEVDYQFESMEASGLRGDVMTLSCRVPTNDPVLPSLIEVFPAVNFHERETAEMLGVVFQGHPNLTRLLLPEDWQDIPPMLKAYRLPGRLEGGE